MKANELKTGDWVLVNMNPSAKQPKRTPFKVDRMKDVYFSVDAHYTMFVNYEDAVPIPLTGGILKKNGWRKQASNHEAQGWSNGHVKLYPQGEKFGGGFTFLYSGNAVQYIHHVHQLQHLLWALGIDDDLKI